MKSSTFSGVRTLQYNKDQRRHKQRKKKLPTSTSQISSRRWQTRLFKSARVSSSRPKSSLQTKVWTRGDCPSLEWLLKPFPALLGSARVCCAGWDWTRLSDPELSTLNGAPAGFESSGSAGHREWLERRLWDRPASLNHLQRQGGGGGGTVTLSGTVGNFSFIVRGAQ